jgi:hypothetical protein
MHQPPDFSHRFKRVELLLRVVEQEPARRQGQGALVAAFSRLDGDRNLCRLGQHRSHRSTVAIDHEESVAVFEAEHEERDEHAERAYAGGERSDVLQHSVAFDAIGGGALERG